MILGRPLTEADIVERFVGRSVAYMHQEIERHFGRSVEWEAEFEVQYRLERELAPVPGVIEALDRIPIPTCVASSGSHERMRCTLGLTVLYDQFEERIFSVADVSAEGSERHTCAAPGGIRTSYGRTTIMNPTA